MGVNDNFRYLGVGLPQDIERRKQYGDFAGAIRLIDRRMQKELPEALKKCMTVQRELMVRLPSDYPYTEAEALSRIQEHIPDFTLEEFREMAADNVLDWIFVDGEERYFNRFLETLLKTDLAFMKRVKQHGAAPSEADAAEEVEESEEKQLLDKTIQEMKKNGSASWYFRILASVKIHDDCFRPGQKVLAHIPIPAAGRQISRIEVMDSSDNVKLIAPEDAPQRTICFEETMEKNHAFYVDYSYVNTVQYVDAWNLIGEGEQPSFLTEEQPPHIVFTPYIKELVYTLTRGMIDPMEKARTLYDFVTENVNYSFMREYFGLENIAECCARNLKGDCGVQALLLITLLRCAGIPACWQSGMEASPISIGSHDWLEFYVAPHGWLFADPSFGGSAFRAGKEERRRFYFGNLDPFRMVANSAFQADLIPDKAQWRADPYDNQSGEIEYEDVGLRWSQYDRKREMRECFKLK